MSLQDAIKGFVMSHNSLLSEIEKLALHEVIALLKSLYPNDPLIISIVEKISNEVMKLQGIDPTA